MDDIKKVLGPMLYDIEVETNENTETGATDPVFELVRKRGGAVREDSVDPRFGDTGFNSKDEDFLNVVCEMGLGEVLLEKAKKAYASD